MLERGDGGSVRDCPLGKQGVSVNTSPVPVFQHGPDNQIPFPSGPFRLEAFLPHTPCKQEAFKRRGPRCALQAKRGDGRPA